MYITFDFMLVFETIDSQLLCNNCKANVIGVFVNKDTTPYLVNTSLAIQMSVNKAF